MKEPLNSLPEGMKINGRELTIEYAEAVNYPLFRFTIPIFGIVPKVCVNLITNEFKCNPLVTSGRYKADDSNGKDIKFSPISTHLKLSEITFAFMPLKEALDRYESDENVVIHSFYFKKESEQLLIEKRENLQVKIQPKSRIVGMVINPTVVPFDDIICRQVFSDLYREAVKSEIISENVESSFWPAIGAGYISSNELHARRTYTGFEREQCIRRISSSNLKIGISPDSNLSEGVKELLTNLGLLQKSVKFKDRVESFLEFENRDLAFTLFATGFWPIDPFGDAEILFSEKLNPVAWTVAKDEVLHGIVEKFSLPASPENRAFAARSLNQHIFDQSIFNIYGHNSFALASANTHALARYHETVSDTLPWQLFEND